MYKTVGSVAILLCQSFGVRETLDDFISSDGRAEALGLPRKASVLCGNGGMNQKKVKSNNCYALPSPGFGTWRSVKGDRVHHSQNRHEEKENGGCT